MSIFFHRSCFSNGNLSIVALFFSGGTPYPTINNNDLIGKLKSGYRMERPENCAQPLCVLFVILLLHYTDFFYVLRSYFSLKYLLMYNSQIFKQIQHQHMPNRFICLAIPSHNSVLAKIPEFHLSF